ncbi:hypothetical protein [Nocardiopsis halophila]|uniref:hypothetical protein n=1 Tax=Nocardiopsis halophila TaxID=141692 RepID=UPI000347FAAD|nr:hypothetical protein [Nocardiopsis halophila]
MVGLGADRVAVAVPVEIEDLDGPSAFRLEADGGPVGPQNPVIDAATTVQAELARALQGAGPAVLPTAPAVRTETAVVNGLVP